MPDTGGPVSRKAEAVLRTLKTNRLQPRVQPSAKPEGGGTQRAIWYLFFRHHTQEAPSTELPWAIKGV
jgi:hypothetical protein